MALTLPRDDTYALLEVGNFLVGECVSLGNDWDKVDFGMKSAHDLYIQRLERMAGWLHEVDTGMHAIVNNVHSVDLVLGVKIGIKSLLNVLDDWAPRVIVVHEVTKAMRINNGQTEADAVLLNIGADGLYADRLWREVERRLLALLWWVEGCVEQSIHERRLAKTGFT